MAESPRKRGSHSLLWYASDCEAAILDFRAWEPRAFLTFSPLPSRLLQHLQLPNSEELSVARRPGLRSRQCSSGLREEEGNTNVEYARKKIPHGLRDCLSKHRAKIQMGKGWVGVVWERKKEGSLAEEFINMRLGSKMKQAWLEAVCTARSLQAYCSKETWIEAQRIEASDVLYTESFPDFLRLNMVTSFKAHVTDAFFPWANPGKHSSWSKWIHIHIADESWFNGAQHYQWGNGPLYMEGIPAEVRVKAS